MKVSILMICYNQKKYIAQAIESVLMQEADFEYELIIGDDFSIDGTWEIINQYAQSFSQIKLLETSQNLGITENFARIYKESKGQYLCILEGDDYWVDPRKLQRQADYLDRSPKCNLCFDRSVVFQEENGTYYVTPPYGFQPTLEGLLTQNFIMTPSVMYRKVLPVLPSWLRDLSLLDWPLHIIHASHGAVKMFAEVGCVYRVHSGSSWSSTSLQSRLTKGLVFRYLALNNLISHLSRTQQAIFSQAISSEMSELALQIQKNYLCPLSNISELYITKILDSPRDLDNYITLSSIFKATSNESACQRTLEIFMKISNQHSL